MFVLAGPATAQWFAAAERAAARRAALAAETRAAVRAAERDAAVSATKWGKARVIKTWRTANCSATVRCPLPQEIGNRFQAGQYEEVVLTERVVLRGRLTPAEVRAGGPTTIHTPLYDRSKVLDAGRQRMMNPYGVPTPRSYQVQLQPGTIVYRGTASGWQGGLKRGDELTVVGRIPRDWISPD